MDCEEPDYELRYSKAYDDPEVMTFFVSDSRGMGNELSGDEEGSSGTVRVVTATCTPSPRVVLDADVTLGSEFGDAEPVDVAGGIDVTGG